MKRMVTFVLVVAGALLVAGSPAAAFVLPQHPSSSSTLKSSTVSSSPFNAPVFRKNKSLVVVNMSEKQAGTEPSVKKEEEEEVLGPLADAAAAGSTQPQAINQAATKTVNERLQTELQQAADKEKYGARSSLGKKMGLESFQSTKTDEERAAAIEEARNLNGVNPVVTIAGSMFALAVAFGLWTLTQFLAEYFALHPIESDVLFVSRTSAVVRNVGIGLVSLAAGFFGVTGVGIFALGARVAYGISKGELDATPLKKNKKAQEEAAAEMPNVWDLMMNKKPKRRGSTRGGGDDNNPFGI